MKDGPNGRPLTSLLEEGKCFVGRGFSRDVTCEKCWGFNP